MESSRADTVEGRNWRLIESCATFHRAWFLEGSAVDVVYHFNPAEMTLGVHFANIVSKVVLAPGDLNALAKGLDGRATSSTSFRLKNVETRECAETLAEILQDMFEENRRASRETFTAS